MNGTICITTPPPPLPTTGDCTYTLTLNDSYGDGWDDNYGFGTTTSTVEIVIDGISYGKFRQGLLENTTMITFGVNNGQVVKLIYAATGPGQSDNSYTLTSCSGAVLLNSGTSPTAGTSYNAAVVCPPFQLPSDCLGTVTICASTPPHFTNSINNSGCSTVDINASNDDCIATEGIGSWYYFSPKAAGTIGFTIDPTADEDYDFSLWGPYDLPAHCPNNAPLRCSNDQPWFFDPYNTGLGTPGFGVEPVITVTTGDIGKFYVLYIENASFSTGQDFNFTWQLSDPAMLSCTVLPMELIDLQATARAPVVDVTWATASEQNTDHFNVQRSADDKDYATIGTLSAAGDAQWRNDYLFTDEAPTPGANYYRLEEVDRNGETTITRSVVAFGDETGPKPLLFPNPVKEILNVSFNAFRTGNARLTVSDALGRKRQETTVAVERGRRTERVPMQDLSAGCYSLSITLPSGVLVQAGSFVKQ